MLILGGRRRRSEGLIPSEIVAALGLKVLRYSQFAASVDDRAECSAYALETQLVSPHDSVRGFRTPITLIPSFLCHHLRERYRRTLVYTRPKPSFCRSTTLSASSHHPLLSLSKPFISARRLQPTRPQIRPSSPINNQARSSRRPFPIHTPLRALLLLSIQKSQQLRSPELAYGPNPCAIRNSCATLYAFVAL